MRARVLVPVVAVFAAGLICSIEAASNSFATATGEGVVTTGDTSFGVKNPTGPVEVTVTPRSGWGLPSGEGSQTVNHQPGTTDVITLLGKDGEESQPITIGDVYECQHSLTNVSKHWTDSAAIVVATPYILGLYSDPKDGVMINPSYTYEVHEPTHKVDFIRLPCPNPECTVWHGGEVEKSDIVTNSVVVIELPVTVKKGEKPFEGLVLPYGQYSVECGVALSNECRQCCGGGSTNTLADIYKVDIVSEPYIGLDRTDEGRKTNIVKKAKTIWTGGKPETVTMEWKTESTCQAASSHKEEPFEYRPKDHDTPSPCFMGDYIQCKVDIEQKGAKASSTPSNSFTVVKVDVQIGEVPNEETEEKDGCNLYYIPDAKNGKWTKEGTNGLVEVSITCEPSDGAMAEQSVTIDAKDDFLFVKLADDKYEKAKKSYRVKELKDTKFVLHGHAKSNKYLGEEIRVTHPVSGAIDVAKFTVFGRPYLVPDYDRKNGIDDKDIETAKAGEKTFRFWINDDNDKYGSWIPFLAFFGFDKDIGAIGDWDNQVPKEGENNQTPEVDGLSDLLDFTPILVDISDVYQDDVPDKIKQETEWKITSDCYRAVWTKLAKETAGSFQTEMVNECGPDLDTPLFKAEVENLAGWHKISPVILNNDRRECVILVEGRNSGSELEIRGVIGGTMMTHGLLKTQVSTVEDMYRWVNIRWALDSRDESRKTNTEIPKNRPDKECDGRHFITVHGYNVNHHEARGWASEIFKRLWQSGSDSMFTAVDWMGDDGQLLIKKTPNYYINVEHAFKSAQAMKDICDALPGSRHVFLSHSLGNMLTSAAIAQKEMSCSQYYMLNAATPRQSYNGNLKDDQTMINEDWKNVPAEYWAANWHNLFAEEDFRSQLQWNGLFQKISQGVNCYSPNENVANDTPLAVWGLQERLKGDFFGEAGWGVRSNLRKNTIGKMTRDDMICHPLFEDFRIDNEQMLSLNKYVFDKHDKENEYARKAYYLAYAIPATTGPAGGGEIGLGKDICYLQCRNHPTEWPRKDNQWNHSDVIEISYFHVKKFFDMVVNGDTKSEEK